MSAAGRVAVKALVFLAIATATHVATVVALPRAINALVLHKIASANGWNAAVHPPRATADARSIVRPSPDLLYTACAFDVSAAPLRVTAPVQDTYVSVAGFASDTSNFFSVNDGQVAPGADGARRFDVVIVRDAGAAVPAGALKVVSPSARGLILFRSLVPRDADEARLRAYQVQQRCDRF